VSQNSVVIGSLIITMIALKIELNLHLCLDNFLKDRSVMDIAQYTRDSKWIWPRAEKKLKTKYPFTRE